MSRRITPPATSPITPGTTPRIVVVGLGPGDPALITAETRNLIATLQPRFLRTSRHPSADVVLGADGGATTFDHHYEHAESFDDVYRRIVDDLVGAAESHGTVLYAVPGSPLVLEKTVAMLSRESRVRAEVHPALSFLDEVWRALDLDPVEASVRLVDGHRFAESAAGADGALLVAHVHANWVLSEIKLSLDDPDDSLPVILLHHLGLDDECIVETTWSEMDRVIESDHLTSLFVPRMREPVGRELVALHGLARTLRERCPWDREQTHTSLTRYLLEEAYELVDAIEATDQPTDASDPALIEELGDLLYQVYFHAAIAEEGGRFTLAEVARAVHDKLVRRHPHVFGSVTVTDSRDVETNWEAIKRQEKPERTGTFDGVIDAAPSLSLAAKVQQRASRVGLDWSSVGGVLAKIDEELDELRSTIDADGGRSDSGLGTDDELGDVLFTVVNLARHLGIDPETSLRRATGKFRRRAEAVERLAEARGAALAELDPATIDSLWREVKRTSDEARRGPPSTASDR